MGIKQPALGIAAAVLVMAVSLGFISLFSFPVFSGWVSYWVMCGIPTQIMIGITWGCKQPGFAGSKNQPLKGSLLVVLTLLISVVVGVVHYFTVGGKMSTPPPMAIMCIITSVIVTFWGVIMWGGWPFTAMIKNPVAAGLALLAACYVVNFALFEVFFDYGFMKGAPVYVASLDPHGMFNAWYALVFYVTASAVMFLMINFDLWPLTKSPALMKQPVLGIIWTAVVLVGTALAMYLGINVAGMDPVDFMIRVPIPFIFGTIIVLNMLHRSLFKSAAQPLKGILNAVSSTVIGVALAAMYGALVSAVTGKLPSGPPGYDFEIWLASSLLGITFPFLIYYAEFFEMWPLKKVEQPQLEAVGAD